MTSDAPPVNTGRIQGGRFRKGASGNPSGKPRGARNRVTVAVESLMGEYGPQVTARVIKRACEGDMGAAGLVLERIAPLRRGHPVRLKLPEISDAVSVMNAHATLLDDVASGKLTPEEAEPVSAMLGAHLKTIETVDIDRRLRELENKTMIPK
jgi:hypothetical protein